MSLTCAVRALFAALVSAVAIAVVIRRSPGFPAAVARLGSRAFQIVSLVWPRRKKGALITRIGAGSPAEEAGLKTGDIIIRFAGQRVMNAEQLKQAVEAARAGMQAQIDVLRDGRMKCLNVTKAKPPSGSLRVDQSRLEAD